MMKKVIITVNFRLLAINDINYAFNQCSRKKYDESSLFSKKISYRQHQWIICANLKIVGFLLRLQDRYTTFPCVLN